MENLYTWKWIEGWKKLDEFTEKISPNDRVHWCETCGSCLKFKVRLIYKYVYDAEGNIERCAEMYFLYMPITRGSRVQNQCNAFELTEKQRMTYEQIRLDRTADLKR